MRVHPTPPLRCLIGQNFETFGPITGKHGKDTADQKIFLLWKPGLVGTKVKDESSLMYNDNRSAAYYTRQEPDLNSNGFLTKGICFSTDADPSADRLLS